MRGSRQQWAEHWYALRQETEEGRRARRDLITWLIVGDHDDEDLCSYLEMGVSILQDTQSTSVEGARQLGELVGLCRGIIRGKQDEGAQAMARHLASLPNYEALLKAVHRVRWGPAGRIAPVRPTTYPGSWITVESPGDPDDLRTLYELRLVNRGTHRGEYLLTRFGDRVLGKIEITERRAKVVPTAEYLTSLSDGARLRKLLEEIDATRVPTAAFRSNVDEQLEKDFAVLVEKGLITRVGVEGGNELVSTTQLGESVLSRLATQNK